MPLLTAESSSTKIHFDTRPIFCEYLAEMLPGGWLMIKQGKWKFVFSGDCKADSTGNLDAVSLSVFCAGFGGGPAGSPPGGGLWEWWRGSRHRPGGMVVAARTGGRGNLSALQN